MQRSGILQAIGLTLAILLAMSARPCRAQHQPSRTDKQATREPGSDEPTEGCQLQPYTGSTPLTSLPNYFPDAPDVRGGIICRFRIGDSLPLFTFHFQGKPDNSLGDIEVTEGTLAASIQTIENATEAADYLHSADDLLSPVDANFDGYNDLQILTTCGGTGNCEYNFYLYDPAKNRFVHNDFLSNLCSPEFHADDKQVTTHSHGSAADWENDTYQYEDSRYTLIHQEISAWDRNSDRVTVSTYERRKGKMELVDSSTDPQ